MIVLIPYTCINLLKTFLDNKISTFVEHVLIPYTCVNLLKLSWIIKYLLLWNTEPLTVII